MALTSTLMATLPGTFSASSQHQEAARKFAPQALQGSFDKVDAIQAEAEDGKAFLAKEGSLLAFSASEAAQASLGKYLGYLSRRASTCCRPLATKLALAEEAKVKQSGGVDYLVFR